MFDLRIQLPGGELVSEITRFVGTALPEAASPGPEVTGEDAAAAEVERLRAELERETKRAAELRQAIAVEKKRLGINTR